ncbi:MAG: hypothetical protein KatS3mg082_0596 [Nitrospiraceae bacterium]|nr:MAG: hypothetical protein KatS3mg082_0596 [Nitrospiraceae bacterium]
MEPTPEQRKGERTIRVDMIARVEGEGALRVTVRNGEIRDVQLRIFEPPRFFEAFLVGRRYDEVPDIVARICGICPVAYQMSAVHALEQAFGSARGWNVAGVAAAPLLRRVDRKPCVASVHAAGRRIVWAMRAPLPWRRAIRSW